MVERLNLKLGIDYLPSRAALPAVNRGVLPIAVHARVCVCCMHGAAGPPGRAKGPLASHLAAQRDAGAGWAWYQVLPSPLDLLAGEPESSARLRAPRRDSWAEILPSRFG